MSVHHGPCPESQRWTMLANQGLRGSRRHELIFRIECPYEVVHAVLAIVAMALMLGACSSASEAGQDPVNGANAGPLMIAEPSAVTAGATVSLRFPQGNERGVGYILTRQGPGMSSPTYYLTSSTTGYRAGERPTWSTSMRDPGWETVGIQGPGPDEVIVPDVAASGEYTLCTGNAAIETCADLSVRP